MGVEPTRDRANGRATVLKTARPTGTRAPPLFGRRSANTAVYQRPAQTSDHVVVGTCRLELRLAENHSLKGKRQVVRSVSTRLRNQFNLAVAEVEENDVWQTAVFGLVCVSNDSRHAHEMLEKAVNFVERARIDAEIVDYQIEVLQVL